MPVIKLEKSGRGRKPGTFSKDTLAAHSVLKGLKQDTYTLQNPNNADGSSGTSTDVVGLLLPSTVTNDNVRTWSKVTYRVITRNGGKVRIAVKRPVKK